MIPIRIKVNENAIVLLSRIAMEKIQKVDKAIHDSGFLIEGEIKMSISGRGPEPRSVDTGRFLGSVQTDISKPLQTKVFSDVEYAPFLEYGVKDRPARRHFRNSLLRKSADVVARVKAAVV